jgi:hypothetical protein
VGFLGVEVSMSSNSNSINSLNSASSGSPVGAMPAGNSGFTNQGNIPFSSLESSDTTDFQEKKKHDTLKWIALAGSVVVGGLTIYISKGKIAEAWKKITHKESKSLKDDANVSASASKQSASWLNDLTAKTRWKDIKKNSHFESTSKKELYQSIIARYEDDHVNSLRAWVKPHPVAPPAPTFDKHLLTEMLNDPEMKPYQQTIAEECLMANLSRDAHMAICENKAIDLNHQVKIHDPEKPEGKGIDMTLFHRLMENNKYQAAEIVSQDTRFNQLITSDGKDFKALLRHYEQQIPSNTDSLNAKLESAKTRHKSCYKNWKQHKTDENYIKERQAWAIYQERSAKDSPERLASLLDTIKP